MILCKGRYVCNTQPPCAGELAGLAPERGGEEKGEVTDDSDDSDFDGDDSIDYNDGDVFMMMVMMC